VREQNTCRFNFLLSGFKRKPFGLDAGAQLCLRVEPGMFRSVVPKPGEPFADFDWRRDCWNRRCMPDIDRDIREGRIIVKLLSGVVCQFTASNFPPGQFGPIDYDGLSDECKDLFDISERPGRPDPTLGIPSMGICYTINKPVARIAVDFTLAVGCGCPIGGTVPRMVAANWSSLTLRGTIPT
jgi:hypothetical protein